MNALPLAERCRLRRYLFVEICHLVRKGLLVACENVHGATASDSLTWR